MEDLRRCRICLVKDVRLQHVQDMRLVATYYYLTSKSLETLNTEDTRPLYACYICRARLRNCYQLRKMCLQSEDLYVQMMNNEVLERTEEVLAGLRVASVIHISLGSFDTHVSTTGDGVKVLGATRFGEKFDVAEDKPLEENSPEVEKIREGCTPDGITVDRVKSEPVDFDEDLCAVLKYEESEEDTPLIILKPEEFDAETGVYHPELIAAALKNDEIYRLKRAIVKLERIDDPNNLLYKLYIKYTTRNIFNEPDAINYIEKCVIKREITVKTENSSLFGDELSEDFDNDKVNFDNFHVKDDISNSNDNYRCSDCGGIYRNKISYKNHKCIPCIGDKCNKNLTSINKTIYKCDICKVKFTRNNAFRKHKLLHASNKLYQCDVCKKDFNNKVGWENHMSKHTGETPYSCDQCDRRFRDKSILKSHKTTHDTEEIFKCDVCKSTFTTRSHISRHMRVHFARKSHKCDVCKKCFARKDQLITHKSIHTGEYQCNVCKRSLYSKYHLEAHMHIHNDLKPFECATCKKCFRSDLQMKRHIMSAHTGERPHQCTVCEKGFITRNNLTQHMRVHTGERPYYCTVCNKYYTRKHIHGNHKCEICKKDFLKKYLFVEHMRMHTGEKPFQCDLCKKCFASKSAVNQHLMRTHMLKDKRKHSSNS